MPLDYSSEESDLRPTTHLWPFVVSSRHHTWMSCPGLCLNMSGSLLTQSSPSPLFLHTLCSSKSANPAKHEGWSLKSADLKFCPKAHGHPIRGFHSSQVLVCRSQWTWPSQDTFITYLTSYFNVLWQLNSLSLPQVWTQKPTSQPDCICKH